MGSIEQNVGRLLAIAEANEGRLDRIETKLDTKVDVVDFHREVSEHAVLHSRINALQSESDQRAWIRKVAEKVLLVAVGVATVAGLALLGIS